MSKKIKIIFDEDTEERVVIEGYISSESAYNILGIVEELKENYERKIEK